MLKNSKEKPSKISALMKPLRLWPGIILVILQWLIRFGLPAIAPDTLGFSVLPDYSADLPL